jgi:hypothetical protein
LKKQFSNEKKHIMATLLKKDVRFLNGLVGEQIGYKFSLLPKTKTEELAQAQKEMENLYDLRNKLKGFAHEAPEEPKDGE